MKKIDIDWMKKIDAVHNKLDRHRPIGSKTLRCTKGILIDRYFSFLDGQAYKLEIKGVIYYALFNKTKHTITSSDNFEGETHYSYGVEKYMGYNDHEFSMSFLDEKAQRQNFKLNWNDILRMRYERIPTEKYWEIVMLFLIEKPKED